MPTYQYACTSDQCGLRFERVQAFTDPAVSECPECSERVRKVYSSVGVVFKGSGFYRNDSREAAKTGASVKSDSGGKDTGKGEAAKSEPGSGSAKSAESSGSGSSGSGSGSAESSSKSKTESAKPAATVAS